MARYALFIDEEFKAFIQSAARPANIEHKVVTWLPAPSGQVPDFNSATHALTGPTYAVNGDEYTESWDTRALTAQEISDAKDAAVSKLNGSIYPAQIAIVLSLENEVRELRGKVNSVIDATGIVSSVSKFTNGQTVSINSTQLKNAIKALF